MKWKSCNKAAFCLLYLLLFVLLLLSSEVTGKALDEEKGKVANLDSYLSADGDADGMPDNWEVAHGLDPSTDDSALDPDSDGLTNIEEFQNDTDPKLADTDGDAIPDGYEIIKGYDPTVGDVPPYIAWFKTFGGSNGDVAYSVQQTSDGGYIIAGWTSSYGAGYDDVYLIKTDSLGNEEWSKTLGGSWFEKAESVEQTKDGGFIIAGVRGRVPIVGEN